MVVAYIIVIKYRWDRDLKVWIPPSWPSPGGRIGTSIGLDSWILPNPRGGRNCFKNLPMMASPKVFTSILLQDWTSAQRRLAIIATLKKKSPPPTVGQDWVLDWAHGFWGRGPILRIGIPPLLHSCEYAKEIMSQISCFQHPAIKARLLLKTLSTKLLKKVIFLLSKQACNFDGRGEKNEKWKGSLPTALH